MDDWYDFGDYGSWVYEPDYYSQDYYTGYEPDTYTPVDYTLASYTPVADNYYENVASSMTGGDWYNWDQTGLSQTLSDIIYGESSPYSLANWTATDIANAGFGDTGGGGSILDDIWGGIKGIGGFLGKTLTNPDLWKILGLTGMITSAAKGGQTTTKTNESKAAQLLPGAQAGVDEILSSALPFARSNVLSPRITKETQDIYDYLFRGGGGTLSNLLNTGQQTRDLITSGAQAIDTGAIGPLWADIIGQETFGKFTPFQQTGSGNVQKAIVDEVTRQAAVPLAQKQADYALQAAGLLPKTDLTQAGLLSYLMELGQYPVTAQQSEFEIYMNVIKALLGLPSGTSTTGVTHQGTDIWSRLLPLFQAMATTGTKA